MANVLETISVLGVDLGKNVCSVVGLDASGAAVLRRRAKRETLLMLAAKLPPCIVAMEACCGAQWALEPLIPPAKSGGRPRETDMRPAMNAIFYLLRTGLADDEIPF